MSGVAVSSPVWCERTGGGGVAGGGCGGADCEVPGNTPDVRRDSGRSGVPFEVPEPDCDETASTFEGKSGSALLISGSRPLRSIAESSCPRTGVADVGTVMVDESSNACEGNKSPNWAGEVPKPESDGPAVTRSGVE